MAYDIVDFNNIYNMEIFNVNTVAAWLMVPYLLWVTFAAYLNIAVAIMN